ncbi:MAG: excalibur calcium-binding domain-containing protein [Mycobacteriales bacterium]
MAAVAPLVTRPKPVATTAPVKAAAPAPVAPAVTRYASCAALNQDYPHGVGRPGAVDHTSGSAPVTTFTVDDQVYEANTARDRDKDGIACERA